MMRVLYSILAAFALFPGTARAELTVNCGGSAGALGCSGGAENIIATHFIPTVIDVLLQIAAGGAVLFIVWAGAQMLLAAGDDGKISKAKNTIIYALGGLALAASGRTIVGAIVTETYVTNGDNPIIWVLATAVRTILTLFNVGIVILVFYAGIRMVMAHGKEDEFSKATSMIKWAVIGSIVVNIAHAVVNALINLGFG